MRFVAQEVHWAATGQRGDRREWGSRQGDQWLRVVQPCQ